VRLRGVGVFFSKVEIALKDSRTATQQQLQAK